MKQFTLLQVLSIITKKLLTNIKDIDKLIDHLLPGRLQDKSYFGEKLEDYHADSYTVCTEIMLNQNKDLNQCFWNFNSEEIDRIGLKQWLAEKKKILPAGFDFRPATKRKSCQLKKLKAKI